MRWEALFEDMTAQLVASEGADRDGVVADLTRAEQATIHLAERLRDTHGVVQLELQDGTCLSGELRDTGDGWLLVAEGARQHVVPTKALASVVGLARTARPVSGPRAGLGLGHVLRGLMRDRQPVQVRTSAGVHPGWITRVGKDHVDLEVTPGAAHGARTVPFPAVLCVSEASGGAGAR
ncbi:hypothetical protein IF650_09095 [Cellulosimicrobium terreum]|nr:hypothetical protein [Cellulosimicrobium terreum]